MFFPFTVVSFTYAKKESVDIGFSGNLHKGGHWKGKLESQKP